MWYTGNCPSDLNLTILTNGTCENQKLPQEMKATKFSGILRQKMYHLITEKNSQLYLTGNECVNRVEMKKIENVKKKLNLARKLQKPHRR